MDQNVGIFELGDHLLRVGDEVGRDVAAVELHAFDDFQFRRQGLGFFDRDHAFITDLGHGFGDHLADFMVAVRRNRADLADLFVRLDLLGALLEVGDDDLDRLLDAALQVHRVHAGGNRLGAFAHDGAGQNRGRRRAVAGRVVGLGGHFAHHLGAHVLELVGEFDLLRHRHAVLGRARGAEALLDDDVAALGAERHLHCIGENVDAAEHPLTRIGAEFYVFGCHVNFLLMNCSVWNEGLLRQPSSSRSGGLRERP